MCEKTDGIKLTGYEQKLHIKYYRREIDETGVHNSQTPCINIIKLKCFCITFIFIFYSIPFKYYLCISHSLFMPLKYFNLLPHLACLISPVPVTPQSNILQSITNNFFYIGYFSSSSFFLCVHFHVPPIFAQKVGGTIRFCAHSSHTAELFMPLISSADPRGLRPCQAPLIPLPWHAQIAGNDR